MKYNSSQMYLTSDGNGSPYMGSDVTNSDPITRWYIRRSGLDINKFLIQSYSFIKGNRSDNVLGSDTNTSTGYVKLKEISDTGWQWSWVIELADPSNSSFRIRSILPNFQSILNINGEDNNDNRVWTTWKPPGDYTSWIFEKVSA